MSSSTPLRLASVALIVIFLSLIYLPFLGGILQPDKRTSALEKRSLATLPAWPDSWDAVVAFPAQFNDYYSDHFGFREKLTKKYFKLLSQLTAESTVADVTFGQNNWLFLGSTKPGYNNHHDPMGDAMNINLFSQAQLQAFASRLSGLQQWLQSQGIAFIYVIAPNKHSVYFEQLPEGIKKLNPHSATDQLVSYLREHTAVTVADLRPAVMAAKQHQQVFRLNDTHWNHYGANAGQYALVQAMNGLLANQLQPRLLSSSEFTSTVSTAGDLTVMANIVGKPDHIPAPVFSPDECQPKSLVEPLNPKHHTLVCEGKPLRALVYRDSFFKAMQPYIARQFGRSTYIWERATAASLREQIAIEKPDIVIEEIVERWLPYVPEYNFQP